MRGLFNEIKMKTKSNNLTTKFSPLVASVFLVLFIIISLWLILAYAEKERNRDLTNWQSRLAMLAEIRSAAVEDWIEERKNQLDKLADNASLKLFLTEHNNKNNVDEIVLSAVQGHVRNLLRASAERFGFAEDASAINKINMQTSSEYGLAILDAKKQLILSTKGFPKNIKNHIGIINKVFASAKPQIIDLYSVQKQQAVYGYMLPVFQIQDTELTTPVGAIMLLLNPQKNLYNILKNKQSITRTDESLLVKQDGASLVYISPIKDEYKLFHRLPDNNRLASSYAFHNPGDFKELMDYTGNAVLVTARKIKNTKWRLIQKISAAEALAESNKHQVFLLTAFTLFVLMVSAAFIAIWRHSTSLRLQSLSETLAARTDLLDAVTNNIKDNIILLNEDSKIIFMNPVFAKMLSLDLAEIKSKHITVVLGKETSELLINSASENNKACVLPLHINQKKKIYHITATRLTSGEYEKNNLYVLHDISELKQEQEKREQLGRGIIGTLVKAVDMHDPFCANHSARTREVSLAIANEMDLSEAQLESLEMAALLANIGKLYVPKEILTKMEPLSADESKQLKQHIEFAVDILSELSFNGPVVDIISQKNERLDGSGYPKGLLGDEIMLESKILAVANAFVAMASSRAYREGRAVKEVIDMLLEQSEAQYDRHVVAALFHISENKADWKTWQSI
ncbi:Phosphate regulon sensor protein PhoR (SphS) [hydrothermal vent metagenome]|uniref:Phosphate regulon sensor protein PhoR (SphS) n=1 Tax=hydrothermal vent metagenome TaxID=652676 RepID=A0A3B0X4I4_9ZZZZ